MSPVILGMNNPHSERPDLALWPAPVGCAGWRLWQLLRRRRPTASRSEYCKAFDRRNLCMGSWSRRDAARAARTMAESGEFAGRTVLLLGEEVRAAFGVRKLYVEPQESGGVVYRQLPHPSGLCRYYNDPDFADVAALLLEELYLEGVRSLEEEEEAACT